MSKSDDTVSVSNETQSEHSCANLCDYARLLYLKYSFVSNPRGACGAYILTTAVMIGMTVSVSGGIGFVGLVAPHVARILVGGNHRRVFPVSALMGGIFVLWCDVLARMIFAPEELSVGIITAIIGGPCFIILLKRKPA